MCLQGVGAQHFLVLERYVKYLAMHYVYVLVNPKNRALYYGYSSDLKTRIKRHREREHIGWKLAYYEAYLDESEARVRERKLKQYGASRGHLKKRINSSIEQVLKSAG